VCLLLYMYMGVCCCGMCKYGGLPVGGLLELKHAPCKGLGSTVVLGTALCCAFLFLCGWLLFKTAGSSLQAWLYLVCCSR
jgi:hypothetical protein